MSDLTEATAATHTYRRRGVSTQVECTIETKVAHHRLETQRSGRAPHQADQFCLS